MNTKKKIILTIISIIVLMCSFLLVNYSYGADTGLGNLNEYKEQAKTPNSLSQVVGKVLGVIRLIGTVLSVAMVMVMGIKFILGSAEEKAEYKQSMKPYLIGAFMLFSGTFLPEIIYKFSQSI